MNVGKLTVIVGLPGSGKSTKVRELRSSVTGLCVEDFPANAIGNSTDFEKSRHTTALIEVLRAGRDCVIADIAFCVRKRRDAVEKGLGSEFPISWVYFENSPEKCIKNILSQNRRDTDARLKDVEDLHPHYCIPPGSKVLPVWEDRD